MLYIVLLCFCFALTWFNWSVQFVAVGYPWRCNVSACPNCSYTPYRGKMAAKVTKKFKKLCPINPRRAGAQKVSHASRQSWRGTSAPPNSNGCGHAQGMRRRAGFPESFVQIAEQTLPEYFFFATGNAERRKAFSASLPGRCANPVVTLSQPRSGGLEETERKRNDFWKLASSTR
jgi:hypothetical protein